MGLGGTAKKLQKVADTAEELYRRLNELREQIQALRAQVETTGEKVDSMEATIERQQVILAALAEKQGLDVDELLAEAAVEEEEKTVAESAASDAEPAAETPTDGTN
ncbi:MULTISPECIES: DUF5798 family protein [unclassified Haladaptatus]|uniref:DUF5798 family protein n=1 Tax=unclassified Haladaptatus TaxID=2622732 RepID=UPI0023E81BF0|nr:MULTISPECIES: DUF5798 family protein [unclassified Haladaptatus]